MSRRFAVVSAVIFIAGAAVWLGSAMSRAPGNGKEAVLKSSHELLRRTSKLRAPFSAELESSAEGPIARGARFSLSAAINVEFETSQLNYQWILPRGVRLASGYPASGSLSGLNPDTPPVINAEFINNSGKNEVVLFRIWSSSPSGPLQDIARYHTQRQQEINQSKAEILERQKEYFSEHPEALKIYR